MERDVLFTGVGGQGVQLAAKALAVAAISEGYEVMLVPRYGGGMRGGMTNAEVTLGTQPLRALPVASGAWSAYAMDPTFWSTIASNLRPGALVVRNVTLFAGSVDVPDASLIDVPATALAQEAGSPMTAGFVLLGAYVRATSMVGLESLHEAARSIVPAYRTQHLEANRAAIDAGAAAVTDQRYPAWESSTGDPIDGEAGRDAAPARKVRS